MRRLLLAALPLALAVAPAGAADRGVDVRDNSFSPSTITVAVGDRVVWTHRGRVLHTVTWDDGTDGSGHMLPDNTYDRTFSAAGSFAYHCEIHSSTMRGTVVVRAAAATTSTTRPPATTSTTTRRTTTTLDAEESSVTAPGETTTTSSTTTAVGEGSTTTTVPGETTTSLGDVVAVEDPGDDDDPSNAGPTAVAALLLAGVAGGAAFAVKRGL